MKRKSLAALIGTCFAVPAFAQSSITMYGIADAGLHFGAGSPRLVSGIADGSRLGFKGTEDLGGGYKAIFTLEARVELNSGRQVAGNVSPEKGMALVRGLDPALAAITPAAAGALKTAAFNGAVTLTNALNNTIVNNGNALFDRTSMVGLITPFGAILGGRMYTPGYEVLAAADTFESGTAGTWGTLTGGAAGLLSAGVSIRSDNAVQYRIQTPNGFGAALMYGFKNSGYVGLDKKFWAANVKYQADGWNVGAGYNHGTDQNGASGLITWTIGGSYATGPMKFFAGYHNMENENSVLAPVFGANWDASVAPQLAAAAAPFGAAGTALVAGYTAAFKAAVTNNLKLDADSWTLGMHYRVGAGRFMGSYNHVNDKTAFNADASQISLGYDYDLSKRTDIYLIGSIIKNKNSAQYAPGAASAPGGFTKVTGDNGRALQIGMRHRF